MCVGVMRECRADDRAAAKQARRSIMARMNYISASPDGTKALAAVHAYIKQSGLPVPFVDLVYLRISLINGCAYCIDTHTRDLLKAGVPQEKITLVPVWREGGAFFDERERAALAWPRR
jgi:AhpD family alkylhydroperoxidase